MARFFKPNLLGTTFLRMATEGKKYKENQVCFFQKFESASDFASRLVSLVVAPIIFTVVSAGFAIVAAAQFLWGLCNYVAGNIKGGNHAMGEACDKIGFSLMASLIAVASVPLNLVDLGGALWNSLPSCSEEDFSEAPGFN
ncbi:hypothetical protein Lqui_1339 [Legionella quinlivanii]|uniref:Uncharacterized protein n=1 Tax=Legionella quinlivanii TaxID=45073 RepID=A0A0W0Y0F5_9GAMM|nr:hypothetical protein [Legionella quinlivanii]KTD50014.1 hypothetical protein Lqui_1339 [Legionella quinlivanii]SEF94663.1 hypothetical protein SAMN02746093_01459 [Legionella quinlivanii DSM 21216]STY11210.1 Uncharacterised protein [Legionella quinlivanii]